MISSKDTELKELALKTAAKAIGANDMSALMVAVRSAAASGMNRDQL